MADYSGNAYSGDGLDQRAARQVSGYTGNLDTAKVAGLIVIGAVVMLGALRHSFAGVRVDLG